jgi:hypothetical protein
VHVPPPGELAGHVVGVGERGDGLGGDEGRRLDAADPGGDERLEHLQLRVEGHGGLELQPVAHAHLTDVDLRGQHQVELGHVGPPRSAVSLAACILPLVARTSNMRPGTVPVRRVS